MTKVSYSYNLNLNIKEKGNEILIETFQRGMNEIRNLAIMKAPVDTANLRNSIQLQVINDTNILITSFANYSSFVEYGTIYMKAQPFLRPAIDEVRFSKIKQIAKEVESSFK